MVTGDAATRVVGSLRVVTPSVRIVGTGLIGTSLGIALSRAGYAVSLADPSPTAVALATDAAFDQFGLHRMEICIRPENRASLRVVQKLGFRYEGLRRRYIHIDGDWRDHYAFALTQEEVPHGVLARWVSGAAPAEAAAIPPHDAMQS